MKAAHTLCVLAVLASAAQLLITTGRTAVAVCLAGVAAASWLHRRLLHAGSAGEVLSALVLGGAGTLIHGLDPDVTGLGSSPLRSAVFVFAFTGLGMAALRLHLDRPEGALPGTLAASGLVFLACGTVQSGAFTPMLLSLFLVLAFAATSADAAERGLAPPPWRLRGRAAGVAALIVVAVPALMWGWGEAGPRLVRKSASAILDLVGPRASTGFHEGAISLHALDGLTESDTVVMRIDGPVPEHLRGNVYVTYDRGRWVPADVGRPAARVPLRLGSAHGPAQSPVRVEYVSSPTSHFFLPLGARPHQVEPDTAVVDAWQRVRAEEGVPSMAEHVWPATVPLDPSAPGDLDLGLSPDLHDPLRRIAAELAGPGPGDAGARARRIESALATGFEYSTSFRSEWVAARKARPGVDPILLFLENFRAGHCEYFGSALALLLRSEGIPTRLVSGYRVAERNPLGGWVVVRERHAHVWVEAYLPREGWVSMDGTPISAEIAAGGLAMTPRFAASVDWLGRQARLYGRSLLLGVLIIGLAAAQIVRLVRGRIGQGDSDAQSVHRIARALQSLLDRLRDAGFERASEETLEALARRLRSVEVGPSAVLPDPAFIEAAELLDRYAALRYGDVGHRAPLEAALSGWPEPSADHSSA